MARSHLVIPDQHAHWEHSNERADYLALLIQDLKPDVVINMGDAADMPSLSSYDKGKRDFQGRTYSADINAHLDFQERLWGPSRRQKKKRPYTVFLEGNHENRIERALNLSPELQGTISLNDLDLNRYYKDVVRYEGNTPGTVSVDGIVYAHYFIAGVSGKALQSEHHAATLLSKNHLSSTASHSHLLDFAVRPDIRGRKLFGLVSGCYMDYRADWAGEINNLWWSGIVFCKDVEDGEYDPQFISLTALKNEYQNNVRR